MGDRLDEQQGQSIDLRRQAPAESRGSYYQRVHEDGHRVAISAVEALRILRVSRPQLARPARYQRASRPTGTRVRGSRRRCTGSSGRSPDDDGEAEPPGLMLWRHPRWGLCSPPLLRALVRTAAR